MAARGRVAVPSGAEVRLDSSASSSSPSPGALLCPLAGNRPVPVSPIVEIAWDLDGDRTPDSTDPVVTFTAPQGPTEQVVRLLVRNEAGGIAEASVNIDVAAPPVPDAGLVADSAIGSIDATSPTGADSGITADAGTAPPPLERAEGLQCSCDTHERRGSGWGWAALLLPWLLRRRRGV